MPSVAAQFEIAVRDMLNELLSSLPPETADIDERNQILVVIPRRAGAASIGLHLAEPIIDFWFEDWGTWELDDENALSDARSFAQAVIQGRCGGIEGWIARVAWIQPDETGKQRRIFTLFHPRLIRKKVSYLPYAG